MAIQAPALVLYWLKDGGSGKFPAPPLDSILDYKPLPAVVNLFAATIGHGVEASIRVDLPPEIESALSSGMARELQRQGIAVVLSILNGPTFTWSGLSAWQNGQLATSIQGIVSTYGIDGIDIDDENAGGTPDQFYETVKTIRRLLPDIIISNAVYDGQDRDKYVQHPDLVDMVTYCSTMEYGDIWTEIRDNVKWFNKKDDQETTLIPMNKLCAGVQAGPAKTSCDNGAFTSIATSKQVAQWAKTNCLGVMLFTFSQDIARFTDCPQHQGPYPNPQKDHAWQKAISTCLFSPGDCTSEEQPGGCLGFLF